MVGEPLRAAGEDRRIQRPWAGAGERISAELGVDPQRGLQPQEAEQRLRDHGPNRLRKIEHRSVARILLDQVKSLVVLLLFAAAGASAVFRQWSDAAAIGVVVLVNTAIGFFTELRARRSMEALQQVGEVRSRVLRGGREQQLSAEEVVPGDVLLLREGEVVAADVRIVQSEHLQIDESALTGESVPVEKQVEPVPEESPLADRTDMAFRGTVVTRGAGRGVVVATGMGTEIGRVSALVEEAGEERTPLERRLEELGRRLIWLTLAVAAAVTVAGLAGGRDTFLMIETGIALAVAAIPEGLPIVATVALARGVHRMLRRQALVRRLSSVETLGSTNVICTDKTGTLTENEMTVGRLVTATGELDLERDDAEVPKEGDPLRRAVEVGVLCNQASPGDGDDGPVREGRGDPMELALLGLGEQLGVEREGLLEHMPQLRVEGFDHETKMMATFHRDGGGVRVAVKGAPEAVLQASTRIAGREGDEPMDDDGRREWAERSETLAEQGLRLLGLAEARVQDAEADPYRDLRFLGLVGLVDPPRETVPDAVRECRAAGIGVVMVTGDHPATARAIARQVGIVEGDEEPDTIVGSDFPTDPDRLGRARVVARVGPEQKLKLIDAHRRAGRTVAMTGDGVNDAPALKSADIGVAMGRRGTEVAREASDMVLLDDAFETIVEAVRQGRVIFDNIRKFVVYLLSGNVGEVLAVGLAALTAAPLPLLPLQILYLNVLNDVFPALALGVGGGSGEVMRRPPRAPGEGMVTRYHWAEIGGYGVVIGATVLGVFALALGWLELDTPQAVTVSFLTLSIARLWHVLNMRNVRTGILRNEVVRNPWMWGAVVLCIALLLLAVYVPPLAGVLALEHPGADGWALVAAGSLVPLVLGQTYLAFRGRSGRNGG
ncbi:MAG: cation-translocating P-type ATPase [Myxococcota bacterium]